MRKEETGNSVLALGIVLMLFLLFLFFKPGIDTATGLTTHDVNILSVNLERVIRYENGSILETKEEIFGLGDEIGCLVEYTNSNNIDIKFLAKGDIVTEPRKEYKNIENTADNRTNICTNKNGNKLCIATYKPEEELLGEWHCQALIGGEGKTSNGLEMGTSFTQVNNTTNTNVSANATQVIQECSPLWDCQWSECENGQQTCAYFDRNNCEDESSKPQDLANQCQETTVSEEVEVQREIPTAQVDVKKKKSSLLIPVIIEGEEVIGSGIFLVVLLIRRKRKQAQQQTTVQQEQQPTEQNTTQQAQSAAQQAQSQTPQTTTTPSIKTYIEQALQQNMQQEQIKSELQKAGWNMQDVEKEMNQALLRKFVNEKKQQGFSKDKIKESLKAKGWKDEIIDQIFKELNL